MAGTVSEPGAPSWREVSCATKFPVAMSRTLSPLALEALLLAEFPGNIRQLKALVVAGCLRVGGEGGAVITLEHLPSMPKSVPKEAPGEAEAPARGEERATAIDRATLEAELRRHRGNIARVAEALGYSRSGLYLALRRLGIEPKDFRDEPATPGRG